MGHEKQVDEYLRICHCLCKEVRDSLDQLVTLSGDRSHKKRFSQAWKALLSRSTTKPEDVHAIVANLTGFSAREVLKHEKIGERMRSIYQMLNELPLDFLFVDGVKYRSELCDADQWMPIWPCHNALTSGSSMVPRSDGYLMKLSPTDHMYTIEGGSANSSRSKIITWQPLPAEERMISTSRIEVLDITCLGVGQYLSPSS